MELTFMTDVGQTFVVEIDPNMELENVMALLEAEVRHSLTLTHPPPYHSVALYLISLPSQNAVLNTRIRAIHILRRPGAEQRQSHDPRARCAGRECDAHAPPESRQCRRQVRTPFSPLPEF